VKDADWEGPVRVPADHIDLANRDSWAAPKDGRVAKFRVKLQRKQAKGEHLKPVVLVRTPTGSKDVIADAHHRALASIDEGQPVWAYVGRVSADTDPWDEIHASQIRGNRRPTTMARSRSEGCSPGALNCTLLVCLRAER
jgi:hypothetical protein